MEHDSKYTGDDFYNDYQEIKKLIRKKFREHDDRIKFIAKALPIHLERCREELSKMSWPTGHRKTSFRR